jgi:asparagine synthase (glutamine-hydrolysing)
VAPEANRNILSELLATRYVSGSDTLFMGIHKLLPGHRLVFDRGRITVTKYWDLPLDGPDPELARMPDRVLVERFRDLLQQSVRLRLMADVPLGMFLSGGLDSSAIAALMAREVDRPIQTFSVAFADRAFSELEYSRQVARAVGADSHEIVIDGDDFFDALPKLIWHEDEPIAHPSSVPLHFVSTLARGHVKVVLTGEGSDELLAGYGKYSRSLLNWRAGGMYQAVTPAAVRATVASSIVPRLPGRMGRYARRSFLAMPRLPAAMFLDNFAGMPLALQDELLDPSVAASAGDPYLPSLEYFARSNGKTGLLGRLLYTDIKTYLVELLMKQDQMSMSASIESRVPFLDHVLVELVTRLPDRVKLGGLTTKRILRDAIRGLLPESILTRRKMGFPVPFHEWLRGPWSASAREVLLDRRTRERGLIRPAAIARLLEGHRVGALAGGDAIWALLNLELWYRTFIDGDGIQTLPVPAGSGRLPASESSQEASARPRGSALAREGGTSATTSVNSIATADDAGLCADAVAEAGFLARRRSKSEVGSRPAVGEQG